MKTATGASRALWMLLLLVPAQTADLPNCTSLGIANLNTCNLRAYDPYTCHYDYEGNDTSAYECECRQGNWFSGYYYETKCTDGISFTPNHYYLTTPNVTCVDKNILVAEDCQSYCSEHNFTLSYFDFDLYSGTAKMACVCGDASGGSKTAVCYTDSSCDSWEIDSQNDCEYACSEYTQSFYSANDYFASRYTRGIFDSNAMGHTRCQCKNNLSINDLCDSGYGNFVSVLTICMFAVVLPVVIAVIVTVTCVLKRRKVERQALLQ